MRVIPSFDQRVSLIVDVWIAAFSLLVDRRGIVCAHYLTLSATAHKI